MKRLIMIIFGGMSLLVSLMACAAPFNQKQAYMMFQGGYANLDYDKKWLTKDPAFASVRRADHSGLVGRFSVGYQLTPKFAAELGYGYFAKVIFHDVNDDLAEDIRFQQDTVDFMLKWIIPTQDQIRFYGKMGMVWTYRSDLETAIEHTKALTNSKITPAFGIGFSYNITPRVFIDASYNYYCSEDDLRATRFATLGLGYEFL